MNLADDGGIKKKKDKEEKKTEIEVFGGDVRVLSVKLKTINIIIK